jgi:hypothetical protein
MEAVCPDWNLGTHSSVTRKKQRTRHIR